MTDINNILKERGKRYGIFANHAKITQGIKKLMREDTNWDTLDADQQEALDMVAHKIGRILNGDPNYDDSWIDISGYITLVVQRLQKDQM